ncbi:hypothetical protein [Streptomyces sp. RKAG337]|uniref:hypothetical protein n=1 Tax=Streptomyces sp. RKAG337 TaxID=2893404 RepID=UPI0020337404|nr:hypothetical protein [Streptomyces sp. RKAG337]MCM2425179.1 hypothetical protein [Streptomyces sp. RKAG337]
MTYKAFAAGLGTPSGPLSSENRGSDPTSAVGANCTQSLSQQSGGTPDSALANGVIDTKITFWHDVDLAKRQFNYSRETDAKDYATDGKALSQPDTGTEAYRYLRKQSGAGIAIVELVARHSNLQVSVRVIASSRTAWTDAQITGLFEQTTAYTQAVLTAVHVAAPAPAISTAATPSG